MSEDEESTRTLSRIAAILQIAHRDAIEDVRTEVLKDETNKAIFASASTWISTEALQLAAMNKGASSKRTVLRRLGELVERGFLERREVGRNVEYRSSGLI